MALALILAACLAIAIGAWAAYTRQKQHPAIMQIRAWRNERRDDAQPSRWIRASEIDQLKCLWPAQEKTSGRSASTRFRKMFSGTIAWSTFRKVLHECARERRKSNRRYLEHRAAAQYSWLEGLNDQQREAAMTGEDATVILAGAGTGKTKTLIARVADLLQHDNIPPEQVAVVSFTVKSAEEIKSRVQEQLDHDASDMCIGTIHALARKIIEAARGQRPRLHPFAKNTLQRRAWISNQIKGLLKADAWLRDAINEHRMNIEFSRLSVETVSKLEPEPLYRAAGKGETTLLRSKAESAVALALWTHRIEYEYEREMSVPPSLGTEQGKSYHPDFYLPRENIWIEVWAFGDDGSLSPDWTENERSKYRQIYHWKCNVHQEMDTQLVEVRAGDRWACLRRCESFSDLVLARISEKTDRPQAWLAERQSHRRTTEEVSTETRRLWGDYEISGLSHDIDEWVTTVRNRRLTLQEPGNN